VRIDEIEPIPVAGVNWHPLRRTLGIEAFGINAYTGDPGEHVVERHTEADLGHEEVYIVLSGRATFVLGGETLDAPAGTFVHLRDPSVQREATAEQAGTTVLAIGGKPGAGYAPSPWETFFAVERFRPSGDYAAAIAELEEWSQTHPDHAGFEYALACWYALAGETDIALDHARRAIALDPRWEERARQDEDLASIHDRL
jgi:quercetin dioxygenase-like cupin family protein